MSQTPSERATQWQKQHPERVAAAQAKKKVIKVRHQTESLNILHRSPYQTPMQAIKGFCHQCPHGTSRNGKTYNNAPVFCEQFTCPLFAFRNGNPTLIQRGFTRDMSVVRQSRK